jgi:ribosomally synthesized peptide (two-chain TOMM family)
MSEENLVPNLDEALIILRTTWLRVIAHAWSDSEWRHRLTEPRKVDPTYTTWDIIESEFPSLKKAQLRNYFDLVTIDSQKFLWIGDDWSWPSATSASSGPTEGLTLYLPLKSPIRDSKKRAIALADYYSARPTVFSPPPDIRPLNNAGASPLGSGGSTPFLSSAVALAGPIAAVLNKTRATVPQAFNNLIPSDGHLISSGITFYEFGVALLSIIAKAWENEAFVTLIQNPDNFQETLQYVHGYKPPWQLSIQIKDDENAQWCDRTPADTSSSKEVQPSRWINLRCPELRLALPHKPQRLEDWPAALAAYNATGAQYPFTCCGTES